MSKNQIDINKPKETKFKKFFVSGVVLGVLLCGAKPIETPHESINIKKILHNLLNKNKENFVNDYSDPKIKDIANFLMLDTITKIAMRYKKDEDMQKLLVEMGYLGSKELNHGYTKEDLFYAKEFLKNVKNKDLVIYDRHPINEIIAYSLTATNVDPNGAKAADAFLVKVGTFGEKFKETMTFFDAKRAAQLLYQKGALQELITKEELVRAFGDNMVITKKRPIAPIDILFQNKGGSER